MKSPLQAEELLATNGCGVEGGGGRISFPQGCGSWETVQAPVDGPCTYR